MHTSIHSDKHSTESGVLVLVAVDDLTGIGMPFWATKSCTFCDCWRRENVVERSAVENDAGGARV
jgi:hypothetical protein